MVKKMIVGVSALSPLLFVGIAHAQYSTTTAAASVDTVTNGVGAMFTQNIPTILIILIALLGLGWGIRKFKKHVAGKGF